MTRCYPGVVTVDVGALEADGWTVTLVELHDRSVLLELRKRFSPRAEPGRGATIPPAERQDSNA